MGGIDLNSDNWSLSCSDDELSKSGIIDGDSWIPDLAELELLYNNIEKTGTLSLEWRCPGRRAPSPIAISKEHQPDLHISHSAKEEKSDFDFMDEVSSLRLRVRRDGEDTLRGSAKKKTSSFDGIVSNMMRHKRIEQMEREAEISSPPTSTP